MSISNMFAQLNKAVAGNPLAGPAGQGMLDMMSRSGGNLVGGLTGQDPMTLMNAGAQQQVAQEALSGIDFENSESIRQVAQTMVQAGRMQEAQQLMDRADALDAKKVQVLEAAQTGIQEEAARKRTRANRTQAVALARSRGDTDAMRGLQSGALSPEAYMEYVMEKKKQRNTATVSDGAMLVDEDTGAVIAHNPDDDTSGGRPFEPSVHDSKQWDTLTQEAYQLSTEAREMEVLSESVGQVPDWNAGLYADVEGWMLGQLGQRDNPQYLRTQVNRWRNHKAIGMLPKGPASDKDVEIVFQGVPPKNAGREEVQQFLESSARVSKRLAEHDKMLADYIINGRRDQFQADWDRRMEQIAHSERVQATPPEALEFLQANPQTWADFEQMYGWLPEGYGES